MLITTLQELKSSVLSGMSKNKMTLGWLVEATDTRIRQKWPATRPKKRAAGIAEALNLMLAGRRLCFENPAEVRRLLRQLN